MAAADRYAPEFRLKVNGQPLPAAVRATVTSVRYEDGIGSAPAATDPKGLNAADRVEVELANPDLRWLGRHIRGFGFQPFPTGIRVGPLRAADAAPDGTFDIDNGLELELGYAPGSLGPVFRGEITGIEAEFPESGMPVVRLVAHDFLHRLTRGTYARGFSLIPDWLVAAILSGENLLLPAIDPVVSLAATANAVLHALFKGTGRKQKGQSDYQLLKEIADNYDADFWVDGNVLWLSRVLGKEYEPRQTLTWGESLRSFAPRLSTVGQVVGVAAKFTIPLVPIDFVVSVGWDFDREALNVMVVPGAAAAFTKSLIGPVITVINRTLNTPADIVDSAFFITRLLRQKLNGRLTGHGVAVGDPRIRANTMLRLDGMGPDLSGPYRVASAAHIIDAKGYRTEFSVRKEILP